jgi:hypothetical protein
MKTFLLLRKFLEQQLQNVREQLAQTATEYLEEMQARNILPAGEIKSVIFDTTDTSLVRFITIIEKVDDEGYTVTHRYLLECHIDKCLAAEGFIENVKIIA